MANRAIIKKLVKRGKSLSEIGRRFGISKQRVHQIIHHKTNRNRRWWVMFKDCKGCKRKFEKGFRMYAWGRCFVCYLKKRRDNEKMEERWQKENVRFKARS